MYDQHLHSKFSMDSETEPTANVERALALGLKGLTFTDHFDTHPSEWDECVYDYDALRRELGALREAYGSQLTIGHGIEVCYQPSQMAKILAYLDAREFDVVILSVHWFQERRLHIPEDWQGMDVESGTRGYLETVLEAVRFAGELNRQRGKRVFDILGHLDLVKRYTQRFFKTFDVRMHGALVDEILQACREAELVPEINTSTLRQGLDEPMPADWIVERYAALGGEAMSMGSDAHFSDDIGAHFDVGSAILRKAGLKKLAVFHGRQRCDLSL